MLEQTLKNILPEKKINKQVKKVVNTIKKSLKKNGVHAQVFVGGSIAKKTNLADDYDCDLFVRFNKKKYFDKNISDILEKIISFEVERVHGSRDYFQTIIEGVKYEIVPVLKITKAIQAQNITDVSPLHVKWVKKYRKSDQIRLLKAFCKAQDCYGAESYKKGFSGHVLDILTIYYGSFEKVLRAAIDWKEKTLIDVKNYHMGKIKINKEKISSLIVIDPIQPERNAAAALSREKFGLFQKAASDYLANPSKKFFEKKKRTVAQIKKANTKTNLLIFEATPLNGKNDVVGAKILKVYEHLRKQFIMHDFVPLNDGWYWNAKAIIYFAFEKKPLTKTTIRIGPPIHNKKNAENFQKIYENIIVKNKRLYAKVLREHVKPQTLASKLLKTSYIKSRVNSIKTMR
ncbi:hypothetical protein GOV04_03985 [Candidatus Woesearchaeota archaeon]|nr:hypothetical protein [Candidatus Woesearchaeota archaeon]